jgi:hypothetical protein
MAARLTLAMTGEADGPRLAFSAGTAANSAVAARPVAPPAQAF